MKNMNNIWFLFNIASVLSSSITNPFGENGDIDKILPEYFDSRIFNNATKAYHRSVPDVLDNVIPIHEDPICEVGFRFRWSATLGSSAYSSPVIFPSGPQGKRQIFQNTFYQYVEMIGHDGYKPWGWPLSFEESSFQGSPILYDIDGDGINDLGAVDKNGNMYWIRLGEYGQYLEDYHIQIPKLKIKKNWYKNLDPAVMDSYTLNSMFDRESSGNSYDLNGYEIKKDVKKISKAKRDDLLIVSIHQDKTTTSTNAKTTAADKNNDNNNNINQGRGKISSEEDMYRERRRKLSSVEDSTTTVEESVIDKVDVTAVTADMPKENIKEEKKREPQQQQAASADVAVDTIANADTVNTVVDTAAVSNTAIEDKKEKVEEEEEVDKELEMDLLELNEVPLSHKTITKEEVKSAIVIEAEIKESKEVEIEVVDTNVDADAELKPESVVEGSKSVASKEDETTTDSKKTVTNSETDKAETEKTDSEGKTNLHNPVSETDKVGSDAVSGTGSELVSENESDMESYYGVGHMDDYMSMMQQNSHAQGSATGVDVNNNNNGADSGDNGDGDNTSGPTGNSGDGGSTTSEGDNSGTGDSNGDGSSTTGSNEEVDTESHSYGSGDNADPYHSFDDGGYRYYSRFHNMYNDSDYVFTDAHVLSTPVLVDVDGDGKAEVIVAISYYFDKMEYVGKKYVDFESDMYIAGGLGCWDLIDQTWLWLIHLDLTTDKTKFKALIHGTPTIADLDGDGRYEVILGTSLGLLYIIDSDTGFVKRHFPMQFHEIQCQIAVADVWGGYNLEIIVADMGGNLVLLNVEGDILWDRKLSGTLPHTPTIADINGDGQLDIVVVAVGETGSHIWALRGDTGGILAGYPIALPLSSVASSSILIADLHSYSTTDSNNNRNSAATTATTFTATMTAGVDQSDSGDEDDDMTELVIEAIGGVSNSADSSSNKNRRNKSNNRRNSNDPYLPRWTYNTEGHQSVLSGLATNLATTTTTKSNMASKTATATTTSTTTTTIAANNINNTTNINKSEGVHLILASFDGHVYIIDSMTHCTERIDVGEHIYSIPLLDDITGDGFLDLVISTMNGQLIVMESSVPYHPLSVWTSFPRGRLNGFTYGQTGISVSLAERNRLKRSDMLADKLSLSTKYMTLKFDIWDTRLPPLVDSGSSRGGSRAEEDLSGQRRYTVTFSKGTNKGHSLLTVEYTAPGSYTVQLPISPPEEMLLVVGMTTERGLYYEDILPVAIGTKFSVWIKYFVATPIAVLCIPLLLYARQSRDGRHLK